MRVPADQGAWALTQLPLPLWRLCPPPCAHTVGLSLGLGQRQGSHSRLPIREHAGAVRACSSATVEAGRALTFLASPAKRVLLPGLREIRRTTGVTGSAWTSKGKLPAVQSVGEFRVGHRTILREKRPKGRDRRTGGKRLRTKGSRWAKLGQGLRDAWAFFCRELHPCSFFCFVVVFPCLVDFVKPQTVKGGILPY